MWYKKSHPSWIDVNKGDIWSSIVKSQASIKKRIFAILELNKAFDCQHGQIIVIILIIKRVMILIKKPICNWFDMKRLWQCRSMLQVFNFWMESRKEFSLDCHIFVLQGVH